VTATCTESVTDLEELFAAEIPCGGVMDATCRRDCDKPAALLGHGHGCPGVPERRPADFKCISCWEVWFASVASALAQRGGIYCIHCRHIFTSVEDFSDYRPI
jgi:hypothetical protein